MRNTTYGWRANEAAVGYVKAPIYTRWSLTLPQLGLGGIEALSLVLGGSYAIACLVKLSRVHR